MKVVLDELGVRSAVVKVQVEQNLGLRWQDPAKLVAVAELGLFVERENVVEVVRRHVEHLETIGIVVCCGRALLSLVALQQLTLEKAGRRWLGVVRAQTTAQDDGNKQETPMHYYVDLAQV